MGRQPLPGRALRAKGFRSGSTPTANVLDVGRRDRLAGPMRMLVLGGTAWLGRTVAQEALRRGHEVTCLARGSGEPPAGATFVAADRDLDDGLSAVADERWDAVVDVTRHPGHARRAVRDLTAGHRVLVSTGNVYAAFDALEQDEDSPLRDAARRRGDGEHGGLRRGEGGLRERSSRGRRNCDDRPLRA